MTGPELLDSISQSFGPKLQEKTEFRGETTYTILPPDLREVAKFCRDELSFDYLIDITSIDNFGEEPRFEIVYELYSMTLAIHLRLKLRVSEDVCAVDTISDIWPTANWHEREIYDMMGIKLTGIPISAAFSCGMAIRSFHCAKNFRSKDSPAICPMSLSARLRPWKAARLSRCHQPQRRKIANPVRGGRICERRFSGLDAGGH
jgi:NADH-quinone oxidoreductase subunit C